MRLTYFLPNNLDLENLINENRPKFKPFNLQKAKYLLHLISAVRHNKKSLLTEDYVKLSSKSMQHKVHNYYKYWDYFINELKIVERDESYQVNKESKGYRFTEEYRTPIIPSEDQIQDTSLRRKIIQNLNAINLSVKNYPYLNKWYNDKLQIDFDLAIKLIEEEYELKKDNKELWDYDFIKEKYKNPLYQRDHAIMSVTRLRDKYYALKRDENVYRYHTVLTNMRSILRNAITYDGKKLFTLDITNSQPYLSTILLSQDYLIKCDPKSQSVSISFDDPQTSYASFSNKIINKLSINQYNFKLSDSYIMLGLFRESPMNTDIQEYIRLAVGGRFYEELEKKYKEDLGITFELRKDIKATVFQVLFTANNYFGCEKAKPKKLFAELFPEVYKIFSDIKRTDKTVLPRLLQSIESYLIVDVICKRISEEIPNAPIFTIHDSISTTEEYIADVRRIMEEEFEKKIGKAPMINCEEWSKNKMIKHLEKLKQKAFAVAS
ncbi:hypothetical protein OOZ35_04855 [Mesoflavibacter profundi]|uniref:DNA-directed RNA polymerase n=1 Tax=Mesoflavibacter profundi TaxID=2708110 RepID=A0ABT4RYB9_9FLAO|nr:hypothetical protein [Mesoflavibacter profundi]MDA0176820.1 hypothetical protein [Mesoflavibacter profundi]